MKTRQHHPMLLTLRGRFRPTGFGFGAGFGGFTGGEGRHAPWLRQLRQSRQQHLRLASTVSTARQPSTSRNVSAWRRPVPMLTKPSRSHCLTPNRAAARLTPFAANMVSGMAAPSPLRSISLSMKAEPADRRCHRQIRCRLPYRHTIHCLPPKQVHAAPIMVSGQAGGNATTHATAQIRALVGHLSVNRGRQNG